MRSWAEEHLLVCWRDPSRERRKTRHSRRNRQRRAQLEKVIQSQLILTYQMHKLKQSSWNQTNTNRWSCSVQPLRWMRRTSRSAPISPRWARPQRAVSPADSLSGEGPHTHINILGCWLAADRRVTWHKMCWTRILHNIYWKLTKWHDKIQTS